MTTTLNEYWSLAMPIEGYVAQLWRKHRKAFTRHRDWTTISPATYDQFAGRELRLLVLTEPYCEDSSQLVPVVWRLADEVGDLALRVLRQNEHQDLAARYPSHAGHPAIPVFIVMNDQYHEIGAIIERPRRMSTEMTAETRRFQEAHPEFPGIRRTFERMPEETQAQIKQHIAAWRDGQQERWGEYLLEDLSGIVHTHETTRHGR